MGSAQGLKAAATGSYFHFQVLVRVGPGYGRKGAAYRGAVAYLQGKQPQLVGRHVMCFLVLYRAIGGPAQDGDAYGKRLVAQRSAVGITGYGLVVNAIEAGLCLQAAGSGHQQQGGEYI
ncbi:hypothetical protein GCM10009415_21260 [Chitinophaga japonensis]